MAEGGDTEAMYRLGEAYEKGVGVDADWEVARSWYAKAARAGHSRARSHLVHMLEMGEPVLVNKDTYWGGADRSQKIKIRRGR